MRFHAQIPKKRRIYPDNQRPLLINEANVARARAASLVVAAALCNALAAQVHYEMSATDPWWLSHVAGPTIRAFGVEIADRIDISKGYRLVLHLSVVALGWALNKVFLAFEIFIRRQNPVKAYHLVSTTSDAS